MIQTDGHAGKTACRRAVAPPACSAPGTRPPVGRRSSAATVQGPWPGSISGSPGLLPALCRVWQPLP